MSVNVVSTIFGLASWVIRVVIGCEQSSMGFWPPLLAKEEATGSLPHLQNQRQLSIIDFMSRSLGNLSGA